MKNWQKDLIKILIGALLAYMIFQLYTCNRSKPKITTTVTAKKGKPFIFRQKHIEIVDSIRKYYEVKLSTKPKVITKYIHSQPNCVYLNNPCDSIIIETDSINVGMANIKIVDTVSGNRVIGRGITMKGSEKTVTDTIETLRVDTVYVTTNTKQPFGTNAKWFLRGCVACGVPAFVVGAYVPK